MRVNLLKEGTSPRGINWGKMIIIVIILFLFAFLLGNYLILRHNLNQINKNYNKLDQQLQQVQIRMNKFNRLKERVNKLEQYKNFIAEEKYYWFEVVRELKNILPYNARINSLEIKSSQIILNGEARTKRVLIDYIIGIRNSSLIDNLEIENIAGEDTVEFSFKAVYKK